MEDADIGFFSKYGWRFLAINTGLTVLIAVVTTVLNIEPPSSMAVVVGMCSAMLPGSLFARDYGRVPVRREKAIFSAFAFVSSMIVSLVLVVGVMTLLPEEDASGILKMFQDNKVWLFVVPVTLILSLIYYFGIWWGFHFGAKNELKRVEMLQKKNRL